MFAKNLIAEHGDATPVAWLHRDDRYTEKLATPDVSVADLIGDADPIKAATLKLPYSDERVIHFGLIPRAHRGIFVINELPDLQARIQVSLFNILQEGDIQIRGFKVRLPLDIQFVFTANPEDYTNRGSIVTPLKDRIDAQIITHYPKSTEIGKRITKQEARIKEVQKGMVTTNEMVHDLVEQVAVEARGSGVRGCQVGRVGPPHHLGLRAGDCRGRAPGAAQRRGQHLRAGGRLYLGRARHHGQGGAGVRGRAGGRGHRGREAHGQGHPHPVPELLSRPRQEQEAQKPPLALQNEMQEWFGNGHTLDLLHDAPSADYRKALDEVPGLRAIVTELHPKETPEHTYFLMEFLLHGLSEHSLISRNRLTGGAQFKDLLSSMFTMPSFGEDEDDEDEDEKPRRRR